MKFIHQIIRLILVNQNVILFKMVLCKFLLEKVLPFVRKSQINDRKRHTPISHLHHWVYLIFYCILEFHIELFT